MATATMTGQPPVLDEVATELIADIEADPLVPRRITVLAPGGHGKSVLVEQLTAAYRRAGVAAVPAGTAVTGTADLDATVVVADDAHLLTEPAIAELHRLLQRRPLPLVIACRPWPKPPGLAELTGPGELLTPAPFDRDQLATFLASRLADHIADRPAGQLLDFVHAQTGGVPRLADWLIRAVQTNLAGFDPDAFTRPGRPIPGPLARRFRAALAGLDQDVLRYLLAADAGAGLNRELLGELLAPSAPGEVAAAALATGLLDAGGGLLPVTRRALGAVVDPRLRVAVRLRLAELELARGRPVLAMAAPLAGTGAGGASVAGVFLAAAGEALPAEPALSARLFAAAVHAGSPVAAVAAGWARAAALAGDLDRALRLADQVLADPGATGRAGAAEVAGAALAHRGQLGRSAELYQWAAGHGSTPATAFAALGLAGTGQVAAAEQLLSAEPSGTPGTPVAPPTLLAGAASMLAGGVLASIGGSPSAALSTLVRAATLVEPTGPAGLLPDSPAAVAAIAAVHAGELDVAGSVLRRAVTAGVGSVLLANRHRLLQAWVLMLRGQLAAAAELAAAVAGERSPGRPLEQRDALLAVAIDLGLARRNSDLPALRLAWRQAGEVIVRQSVDLFTMLPLGELAVAAARLGDQERIAPQLAAARTLLGALGDPPLWCRPLRWAGLHAALVTEQPAAAREHADALAADTAGGRYAAVLATAARSWLAVAAGEVDPVAVESAARGLHGIGLCWDAARLAGQAAIRTADRKVMVRLLDCARLLQGRPATRTGAAAGRPATAEPAAHPSSSGGGSQPADADPSRAPDAEQETPASALSDREREVADLVVAGLTYKQVGDRLFISAKTVEHHMARMRQKLGCRDRRELLARLRT